MLPNFLRTQPTRGVKAKFTTAFREPDSSERIIKELHEIYPKDNKGYTNEFLRCLAQLFTVDEEQSADPLLDFTAKVCVLHGVKFGDNDPFMGQIIKFIYAFNSRPNAVIRLRMCQFSSKLLNLMGEKELTFDFAIKIRQAMFDRLLDTCENIRSHAAIALYRLQDPYDAECAVIKNLIFHIGNDPSPVVRKTIINNIAITMITLPHIMERMNDTDETVKKAAFGILAKVRVCRYTLAQRQSILKCGINSKKEELRNFVIEEILMVWFKYYNSNMVTLYDGLFVDHFDDDVLSKITYELFKKQPISSLIELMKEYLDVDKVVIITKLTPEVVTLWYFMVEHLSSSKIQGEDDNEYNIFIILPQLSRFTEFIARASIYYSSELVQNRYMIKVLLKIACFYSLSDEKERASLKEFSFNMLCKGSELSYVPMLSQIMQKLVPDVKERCAVLCEIVSNIREDEDDESYLQNPGLTNDIKFKKDPETVLKCLTVIFEFLKLLDVKEMEVELQSLQDHFIKPCLFENDHIPVIKNLILKMLTLLSIRSIHIAKDMFIYYLLKIKDSPVSMSALDGVFDIVLAHGFYIYDPDPNERAKNLPAITVQEGNLSLKDFPNDPSLFTYAKKLIELLMDLLDDPSMEIKCKLCLGMAKLMLSGHLNSSLVCGSLILARFSPEFADENLNVRNYLDMFFNEFASKKSNACDIILGCFMPILKTLEDAKEPLPIAYIHPFVVTKFLLNLLRAREVPSQSRVKELGSYHYRLACMICKQMMSGGICCFTLIEILYQLELQHSDRKHVSTLLELLNKIVKEIKSKSALIMLGNFHAKVIKLQKSYEDELKALSMQKMFHEIIDQTIRQLRKRKAIEKNTFEEPQSSTSWSNSTDSSNVKKPKIISSMQVIEISDDDEEENKGESLTADSKNKGTPSKKKRIDSLEEKKIGFNNATSKSKKTPRPSHNYRTRAQVKKEKNH